MHTSSLFLIKFVSFNVDIVGFTMKWLDTMDIVMLPTEQRVKAKRYK